MRVLSRGQMPDGTDIQIEEWHEDYSFMPFGAMIAAYPISQYTFSGAFAPKAGERYRFSFDFESHMQTIDAFKALVQGSKTLADFADKLTRPEYAKCLHDPDQ